MQKIAQIISTILTPLLMPTYGIFVALWVSILCYLPISTRTTVLMVIFGITCIIPMIIIALLHRYGIISDHRMIDMKDRRVPYLLVCLCYIGAALYLIKVHAPLWLSSFMWGATMAVLVASLINIKWKISAHLSGMGGITAMLFTIHMDGLGAFDILWLICTTIISAGLLASSRIILNRHTLAQVLAGFANGFIWVYLANFLLS